jgi:GDP-4-dehydro-6-deoxy-D-mannose reductase
MSKYLITGFSGFVSSHFLKFLESQRIDAEVLGVDLHVPSLDLAAFRYIKCGFDRIDLLDEEKIQKAILQFRPDYILHLAAYSSVSFSWKNPILSFQNNTNIFLNLVEAVRQLNLKTRILSVGSSEEYGNVTERDLPLREDRPLMPLSPYAVARVSQEMLSQVYAKGFDVDIVITRSFNHIGPGQRDIFVVSSFAKQIAEGIKNGSSRIEIVTGDLAITRDFLDVRDVVRAYHLLLQKGRAGEIYNVCSGRGVKLSEILTMLGKASKVDVVPKTDPQLVRPQDNRVIVGSNDKICGEVAWRPEIQLEQSLADVMEDWRRRLTNVTSEARV